MNQETKHRELALDTATDRVGEIMDTVDTTHGKRVYLRPAGGGREWSTDEKNVQPMPGKGETAA